MTTAAALNGLVAVDTQATTCDTKMRVDKIVRLEDGRVLIGCGKLSRIRRFQADLEEGKKKPRCSDIEFFLIDGEELFYGSGEWPGEPIKADKPIAMGSGVHAAFAALAMGADAVRAVEVACGVDLYSSLPVDSIRYIKEQEGPYEGFPNGNS